MQREEDSGASGPQVVGHTEISDRTRVQPIPGASSDSDIAIIQDGVQRLRGDVILAELRGRDTGTVEFEGPLSWGQDEMRPCEIGDTPGSSVIAHVGLPRGNSGSAGVHDDAPGDAPNGFKDAPDRLHDDQASFDSAGDGSNVAAGGSNDAPNGFNNAADAPNLIADGFEGHCTTSFETSLAQGGEHMDECPIAQEYPPIRISEDANMLTTSSPCP